MIDRKSKKSLKEKAFFYKKKISLHTRAKLKTYYLWYIKKKQYRKPCGNKRSMKVFKAIIKLKSLKTLALFSF